MSTYKKQKKKQERYSPIPLCIYESQKSRTFCVKHYFLDFRFLHSLSVFRLPFSLSICLSSQYFFIPFRFLSFFFFIYSVFSGLISFKFSFFLPSIFLRLQNSSLFASFFRRLPLFWFYSRFALTFTQTL